MAVIGCLGDIPFTVSEETLLTIDNAVWSGSARYAVHQVHLSHAITEFTGLEPDGFSFDLLLSAALHIDPQAAMAKLWKYEREGIPVRLVLGEKGYGKFRWNIVSHTARITQFDWEGNAMEISVSVRLQEYLEGVSF